MIDQPLGGAEGRHQDEATVQNPWPEGAALLVLVHAHPGAGGTGCRASDERDWNSGDPYERYRRSGLYGDLVFPLPTAG